MQKNNAVVECRTERGSSPVKSHLSLEEIRTIVTVKESDLYRIITDDSDNWHLIANRFIAGGELFTVPSVFSLVDVHNVDYVDVILEETQERKQVFTAVSAVPSNASCLQDTLEIPSCFMNHSCEPNMNVSWSQADLKSAVAVAARDIAKGEELTSNYNMEYYEYKSPFECRCGTQSCSGTISGFNGLSSEQQAHFLSHASPFIQEKYRHSSITGYTDMSPSGQHIVVDYWDCDKDLLNDEEKLILLLTQAAKVADVKVISTHSHKFEPEGVTAIAILA